METGNPLEFPRWTLAQTLAWIIHRTPEAVSGTPPTKNVFDVANEAARREGIAEAALSADLHRRFELLDHLKRGTLTAYGVRRGQTEHDVIPKSAWDTIDSFYVYNPTARIGPSDVGNSDESSARFRDAYISPADALSIWMRRDPRASNDRKRCAVDTTIRRFGIDALMAMPQKEREPKIIDFIKSEHGLKVSDRHVRKRLLEARQEQNRS
jgi:hypothetical protein